MEDDGTTVPVAKPLSMAETVARSKHAAFIHAILCPHIAGIAPALLRAPHGQADAPGLSRNAPRLAAFKCVPYHLITPEDDSPEEMLAALQARAALLCGRDASSDQLVLRTLECAVALGSADGRLFYEFPDLIALMVKLARAS